MRFRPIAYFLFLFLLFWGNAGYAGNFFPLTTEGTIVNAFYHLPGVGTYGVGTSQRVFVLRPGSVSWERVTGQISRSAQIKAIHVSESGVIYALNQTDGVIYKHVGGVSNPWSRLTTSGKVQDDFFLFSENEIYSFGTSRRVFMWDGRQWILKTGAAVNQSLYVSPGRVIYAIDPGRQAIEKWRPGIVRGWVTVTAGRVQRDFAFVSEGPHIYSIGLSGDVFEWNGGSSNWSRIAELAGKNARALQWSDGALMVLSGDGKIYREEEPGALAISSNPPGSTVFLNGEDKGLAGDVSHPLTIENLDPGMYRLYLRRDGCPPSSEMPLRVTSGETTPYNIGYDCQEPQTGSLQIDSTPPDANVFLNGGYEGTTPLTIDQLRTNDRYLVRLEKEGYLSWEDLVNIGPGTQVVSTILIPLEGTLRVVTDPPGSDAYLDGVYKGSTPLTIGSLVWGRSHAWGVQGAGYQDAGGTVTVRTNTNLIVPLTPLSVASRHIYIPSTPHAVRIESQPAGARVQIVTPQNRVVREGVTPSDISLQPLFSYPYEFIVQWGDQEKRFEHVFLYDPASSTWTPDTLCFARDSQTSECTP